MKYPPFRLYGTENLAHMMFHMVHIIGDQPLQVFLVTIGGDDDIRELFGRYLADHIGYLRIQVAPQIEQVSQWQLLVMVNYNQVILLITNYRIRLWQKLYLRKPFQIIDRGIDQVANYFLF